MRKAVPVLLCLLLMSGCAYEKVDEPSVPVQPLVPVQEETNPYQHQKLMQISEEYKYIPTKVADKEELCKGLPFDDYLSIQYAENGKVYYIVHDPISDNRQVLLCAYDIEQKQVEILEQWSIGNLYISSFAYINDTLVYWTINSYDYLLEEYRIFTKEGDEVKEIDNGKLLTYYLNSSPILTKVGKHLYYGTMLHDIDEDGIGKVGFKFVKINNETAETLILKDCSFSYYEYDNNHFERYRYLIFSNNQVAALAWDDNKSYVYLYDDTKKDFKVIEILGMQDFMGFLNNDLLFAKVFDGMSYPSTALPYSLYDINTDRIREVGWDNYQYVSFLNDNELLCYNESSEYWVISQSENGNVEATEVEFKWDMKMPHIGKGYALNDNQFLITTSEEVWLCSKTSIE